MILINCFPWNLNICLGFNQMTGYHMSLENIGVSRTEEKR